MPFRRSDRKGFYLAAYIRIGLRDGGMGRAGKRKYFFMKKTPGKIPWRPSSERETGIEPATFSLARRRSTTLLLAQMSQFLKINFTKCQKLV